LENLALRQQLAVLKQKHPQPRLAPPDKLFWVILRRLWPGWTRALILVQPETVVRWHKAGFKMYWTWLSRQRNRIGRKCVSKELRELIFRLVAENSTWGAPRIHGELKMLGFEISERTVLRWMRKAPRSFKPAKRWAAFLSNHREAIAAMDFFTVPTLTFGVLYYSLSLRDRVPQSGLSDLGGCHHVPASNQSTPTRFPRSLRFLLHNAENSTMPNLQASQPIPA
jgi:hypothetical protein